MTEAELAELQSAFSACDPNGDGFIDREEFHALLLKLDGDVSREECLLDFEIADTEGDGYIGFKEFIIWSPTGASHSFGTSIGKRRQRKHSIDAFEFL